MEKLQVYHFHNGSGGGVLSVITNLLQFSTDPCIQNHVIHTINRDITSTYEKQNIIGASTEQVFYYSSLWNFHYTASKLAKLILDNKAVIVAHDWLELGMVSNLGLQNPVVQVLHGDYDYYYQLATRNQSSVDAFITVSKRIKDQLLLKLKERSSDIFYKRFPVRDIPHVTRKERTSALKIIFIGRLTEEKGYYQLPLINEVLKERSVDVQWTIAGEVQNADQKAVWKESSNIVLLGTVPNDELLSSLNEYDLFILPSKAEGMPLSLVESMKAGVVPLVSELPGGITELVIDEQTGFTFNLGDTKKYADRICELHCNRTLLLQLSERAARHVSSSFDSFKNTANYERVFKDVAVQRSEKILSRSPRRIYGSRLDHKLIPNILTTTLRKL